ncbi:MAG: hypothetical protein U9N42_11415 [Campylobacterota bacterium]|nr:hypothetical protein [Campylobacterota bacterium]
MQVSGSTNYQSYQTLNQQNSTPNREVQAGIVEHKVQQNKIDAYKLGMENSNTDENNGATKAYMDFSKDVQRSNNYNEFVDNGGNPADLQDRPTIQDNNSIVANNGYQSTLSQISSYTVGNSEFSQAIDNVKNFNEFAQNANKQNAINAYVANSA